MADRPQFNDFRSQRSSTGFIKRNDIDENDNLFSGVWHLDGDHLERIDPFIGGYAFIVWTKVPAFFDTYAETQLRATERNFKGLSGIGDFSVTTEDMTHGFAGNAIGVATSIQKENTSFSLTHQELKGSPVREIFDYWVSGIHDPETGLATYHGAISSGQLEFSMKNHTGELLYIVTDPSGGVNGNGIEAAFYFTNVFPTKIPMDHLNYQSGDHSLAEISMDFRGTLHKSHQINELAQKFLKHNAISQSYNRHAYGDSKVVMGAIDGNFNTGGDPDNDRYATDVDDFKNSTLQTIQNGIDQQQNILDNFIDAGQNALENFVGRIL